MFVSDKFRDDANRRLGQTLHVSNIESRRIVTMSSAWRRMVSDLLVEQFHIHPAMSIECRFDQFAVARTFQVLLTFGELFLQQAGHHVVDEPLKL